MSERDPHLNDTAKARRTAARREQILDAALHIAEQDGWNAVTTRRVAEAIDYTQPVIYQHFASRDDLIAAIARSGFVRLAAEIDAVAQMQTEAPLEELCRRYLDFGLDAPRLYEAMFSLSTTLAFDDPTTPKELRNAFDSLRTIVTRSAPSDDPDVAAELFWATCHGLVSLVNTDRIPRDRLDEHIHRIQRISTDPGHVQTE